MVLIHDKNICMYICYYSYYTNGDGKYSMVLRSASLEENLE